MKAVEGGQCGPIGTELRPSSVFTCRCEYDVVRESVKEGVFLSNSCRFQEISSF